MLREKQGEAELFERRPFESSRQATYEDTVGRQSEQERQNDKRN